MATSLRLNFPRIACEVIDGEAVLIDFEQGTYFSADGAGGLIFEKLAERTSAAEIIAAVESAFAAPSAVIQAAVMGFLESLHKEEIIVEERAEDGPTADAGRPAPVSVKDLPSAPFVAPKLRKYVDLKDLLLLDPIHETDAAGWPLA